MLIDGHDLREVTQRSLRDQLGVVPQEGHLFTGTIAENLGFGRPEATDDELRAAADAVGAADFIEALPDGFDTEISERGSGLSAGQRQLISLRPRAGRRPAAADPRRGDLVGRPPRRGAHRARPCATLLAGRTSIVIAHRLSTIRDADRIVVLEARRRSSSRAPTTSWWPRAAATPTSTATGRPPRPREALAGRGTFGTIARARPGGGSSSGRTPGSGPGSGGSNPPPPASPASLAPVRGAFV